MNFFIYKNCMKSENLDVQVIYIQGFSYKVMEGYIMKEIILLYYVFRYQVFYVRDNFFDQFIM